MVFTRKGADPFFALAKTTPLEVIRSVPPKETGAFAPPSAVTTHIESLNFTVLLFSQAFEGGNLEHSRSSWCFEQSWDLKSRSELKETEGNAHSAIPEVDFKLVLG